MQYPRLTTNQNFYSEGELPTSILSRGRATLQTNDSHHQQNQHLQNQNQHIQNQNQNQNQHFQNNQQIYHTPNQSNQQYQLSPAFSPTYEITHFQCLHCAGLFSGQLRVSDIERQLVPPAEELAMTALKRGAEPFLLTHHPKRLFPKMKLMRETQDSKLYFATMMCGREIVVKKLRNKDNPLLQSYVDMEIAMSILCTNCDNVINFLTSFRTHKNAWILMEFMEIGSISNLRAVTLFQEREIAYILQQVLKAILYLHERFRIHRDIKSHNILINAKGEVKLMDFGWTVQLTHSHPTTRLKVGSVFWMAPEVHDGKSYDLSADIWSLGILCLELLYGHPPHYDVDHERASLLIAMGPAPTLARGEIWSDLLVSFTQCCLSKNPLQRSSAQQLLDHPFIHSAISHEEWLFLLNTRFPRWPRLE